MIAITENAFENVTCKVFDMFLDLNVVIVWTMLSAIYSYAHTPPISAYLFVITLINNIN